MESPMDKTALKIIEVLKLAEGNNPELALSSLRMASRLAGGSLASWLESFASECGKPKGPSSESLESEISILKDEIEWLGLMLRARNEDIKSLKKAMAALKKEQGEPFDDIAPEKLEMDRLKAELKDAKQALGLITGFVDELIKGLPRHPPDDLSGQDSH